MMKAFLILDDKDNVATTIIDLPKGFVLEDDILLKSVISREPIKKGHKIALMHIDKDGVLIKYGSVIGRATDTIEPGDLVHVHNVRSMRGKGSRR